MTRATADHAVGMYGSGKSLPLKYVDNETMKSMIRSMICGAFLFLFFLFLSSSGGLIKINPRGSPLCETFLTGEESSTVATVATEDLRTYIPNIFVISVRIPQ